MLKSEVAKLLTLAAAYDNRNIGRENIEAWYLAIGDLEYNACQHAIVAHARESTEYLTTAHIKQRVDAANRRAANISGSSKRKFMDWCLERGLNPTLIEWGDEHETERARELAHGDPEAPEMVTS